MHSAMQQAGHPRDCCKALTAYTMWNQCGNLKSSEGQRRVPGRSCPVPRMIPFVVLLHAKSGVSLFPAAWHRFWRPQCVCGQQDVRGAASASGAIYQQHWLPPVPRGQCCQRSRGCQTRAFGGAQRPKVCFEPHTICSHISVIAADAAAAAAHADAYAEPLSEPSSTRCAVRALKSIACCKQRAYREESALSMLCFGPCLPRALPAFRNCHKQWVIFRQSAATSSGRLDDEHCCLPECRASKSGRGLGGWFRGLVMGGGSRKQQKVDVRAQRQVCPSNDE